MLHAVISGIEVALPEKVLTNEQLSQAFPEWTVSKIEGKTGIRQRRIAADDECSSDLGFKAAQKLFASGLCAPSDVDFLLFCTQSPDYFLPTTACLLQHRLGIPTHAGALDFNLGCSGYVYGLGLAKGLIETGQARRVLLITAETYSKFIHDGDKSVRTLFGDAGAATLIEAVASEEPSIGPFVYGTDGRGGENLIVPRGGMRQPRVGDALADKDTQGNIRSTDNLYMNGAEIFTFTLKAVPKALRALWERSGTSPDDVDLFVFHQANEFMLEHLRKRVKIPADRFYKHFAESGNTVSCTIPIALKHAMEAGRIKSGNRIALVGFGVGYSWGATLVRWA